MGGQDKFNTGAMQGAFLPGDDQPLDLVALRRVNGSEEQVGLKGGGGPELPFGKCDLKVEEAGGLAVAVAMLKDAFPGSELLEQ